MTGLTIQYLSCLVGWGTDIDRAVRDGITLAKKHEVLVKFVLDRRVVVLSDTSNREAIIKLWRNAKNGGIVGP